MSLESYQQISLEKMPIRESTIVESLYRTVMCMRTCVKPDADGRALKGVADSGRARTRAQVAVTQRARAALAPDVQRRRRSGTALITKCWA